MNMLKAWRRTLFAAAFSCAVLAGSAFAANEGAAVINTQALNLRAAPNTGAEITAVGYKGHPVVVQEVRDDYWFKVIYNGTEGYMSGDYLDFNETLEMDFGTGVIRGSGVRLRAEASYNGQVIGSFNIGAKLSVLGVSAEWYKVKANETIGYVHSDYLVLEKASVSNLSSPGQMIVDKAMQYMGVPYVWAGTSPKGFDCSGLVFYCFKENGYDTNRTAASLYNNGDYVERSKLQVGDIICFTNSSYSYIGHVGIYIGNDQFIHASSSSGCVTIDSLSTRYYNNHYYGARRIAY